MRNYTYKAKKIVDEFITVQANSEYKADILMRKKKTEMTNNGESIVDGSVVFVNDVPTLYRYTFDIRRSEIVRLRVDATCREEAEQEVKGLIDSAEIEDFIHDYDEIEGPENDDVEYDLDSIEFVNEEVL